MDNRKMTSSREPVALRVFPDYSADPVWADPGMVDLSRLPISERLRQQLREWARDWEDLMGVRDSRYAIADEAAHQDWQERGRHLAKRLQRELGDSYRVEYEELPS
jgi:hypothetical protein